MQNIKSLIFFIVMPFMLALHIAFEWGYGDKDKMGWYQTLWDNGYRGKVLSILLAPIFFTIKGFLSFSYPIWEGLLE